MVVAVAVVVELGGRREWGVGSRCLDMETIRPTAV